MDFNDLDLDDRLLKAVEELGFTKPTNVQFQVIPEALSGLDVLADAPTGTGKTAAFVLPCLQHMLDFPKKKLGLCRILVLTPTRELALQVTEHAKKLAMYLPHISVGTLIGGVEHEEQLSVLTEKTDIVVATPGRLIEYLRKKMFDIRAVEILVLDEADRMLDMGFIDDVTEISQMASRREQTFLFSATLEGPLLSKFANEVLKNPVEIHIDSPRSEKKKINQYKYYADTIDHKVKLLKALLNDEKIEKSIIFVKTRERLMDLVKSLDQDDFKYVYIRGEMDQAKRIEAMRRFSENEVKIMLATDVAARGIDVTDITHVINFDLPRSADIYVHRIGRTARAGRKGSAINLIEAHDVPMMERIEHYTGELVDMRVIDDLKPQHKIADFTKKKKKLNDDAKDQDEKHDKKRKRDILNKGKPDLLAKKAKKLAKQGLSQEEIAVIIAKEEEKGIEFRREKKAKLKSRKNQLVEKKDNRVANGEIPFYEKFALLKKQKTKSNHEEKKSIPTVIITDEEDYYDDDDIEMQQGYSSRSHERQSSDRNYNNTYERHNDSSKRFDRDSDRSRNRSEVKFNTRSSRNSNRNDDRAPYDNQRGEDRGHRYGDKPASGSYNSRSTYSRGSESNNKSFGHKSKRYGERFNDRNGNEHN